MGLAPDGRLIATMNGVDERGSRNVANDGDKIYLLDISSPKNFGKFYGWPNRLLFNRMLYGCKENEDCTRAANSKGEFFSAESWRYNTASFHIIKNSLTLGQ